MEFNFKRETKVLLIELFLTFIYSPSFAQSGDSVGTLIEQGLWKEAVIDCNSQLWKDVDQNGVDEDLFYSLQSLVSVAISPSTRYEVASIQDKGHPHLSYEDNLYIIDIWAQTLQDVRVRFGLDVLYELERFCREKKDSLYINNNCPQSAGESLHFISGASYARLLLAIMFDKMNKFEEEWHNVGNYLFGENLNIVDARYGILCQISETFAAKSNPTMAISILQILNKYVQEQDRLDLSENVDTYIATLAYPIGQEEIAELSTFYAWATAQQPIETYKVLFYDVNNLIKQLMIASYIYTDKAETFLTTAKLACIRDIKCRNGLAITNDTKAGLYNALSVSTKNLIERQQYLEKAIENNPHAVTPYINLALCLSEQGRYVESEDILAYVLKDEMLSNNLAIHSDVRMQYDHVKVLNASAIGSSSTEELMEKRLNNAEQTFLSFADHLTSEERTRYWDNQIGSIRRFFSKDEMLSYPNIAYDATLFEKGILARYDRHIRDNIEWSVNDSLKRKYAAFREAVMKSDASAKDLGYAFQYSYMKSKSDFNKFYIPSWSEIKARLKKKEAAIEFYSSLSNGKEDYFALVITKDTPQPVAIPLPGIDSICQLYYKNNVYGGYSKPIYNTSIVWDSVWNPISDYLKGISTVYYSPHGILHNINIEAETLPNGKRISEKYHLRRLSTTGKIIDAFSPKERHSAAIFGNIDYASSSTPSTPKEPLTSRGSGSKKPPWKELTNTEAEIKHIGSTLSENGFTVKTFERDNGTESAFRSLSSSNTGLIHLATHGFYYNEQINNNKVLKHFLHNRGDIIENRSGLVLAGGNIAFDKDVITEASNDGVLTAGEIVGLDLSGTDLLVLSACQTCLGDVVRDGVYGIQRSFKIAGVNSIIMSLWQVDDESTQLMMKEFYSRFKTSKSKREAFNDAVYIVKAKKKDPYLWAAFIMLD